MNRVKIGFCLFLFLLSFLCLGSKLEEVSLFDFLLGGNKKNFAVEALVGTDFKDPSSLLDMEKVKKKTSRVDNGSAIVSRTSSKNDKAFMRKPIVYFFNTHQTEEYKGNVLNVTPTVMTVSSIMQDELKGLGIGSVVEERSVTKEVKKRGYDYSGSYTVSFEYLKQQKRKHPTLEYFFDMHRDSITGNSSRIEIKGKKYAKMMFLVGANYNGYEKNIQNIKIMEKYLDKHYPGLVRDTYIQKRCSFNQEYSSKMFLVELGGPDNTLEEIYNTSVALANAIKYFVEEGV